MKYPNRNKKEVAPEEPRQPRVVNKDDFTDGEGDLEPGAFTDNTLDITEADEDEDEGVGDGNLESPSDDNSDLKDI